MGPLEPGSASDRTEPVAPPEVISPSPEQERSRSHLRIWIIVLSATVVAGLISWLGGEAAQGFFKPRLFVVHLRSGLTSLQPSIESLRSADFKNAALASAILGAVTALAMSFAGGLVSGSPARGAMVGLGMQAVGALAGVLATIALFPLLHHQPVQNPNDMLTPIVVQAGIWMTIGTVAGMSFVIGSRNRRHPANVILAGCCAAVLAAVLYHLLIGGLFFDSGPTTLFATTSMRRLIALLTLTILIGAGAARAAMMGMEKASHDPHPLA
jgi:hypothetical protein